MERAGTLGDSWHRPDVCVVDDLFTAEDIARLSAIARSVTYDQQGVSPQTLRPRGRAIVDDPSLAGMLWERASVIVSDLTKWFRLLGPDDLDGPVEDWHPRGCNPVTRLYRYDIGASFPPHTDEPWRPDEWTRSILTMLLYLPAGGCEGGETVVDGEVVPVVDGRMVLFRHSLLHEGRPVERGTKLVLRNDIVATRR